MCLIATAEKKELVKLDNLENAYDNNPHGWGIVYAQDNKLFVCKKQSNFKVFKKVWELVPEDAPIAIHFRWATHGEKSLDNIHPFAILNLSNGEEMDLCLMHNGVISGVHTYNDPKSDTQIYVEEILRPIIKENPKIIENPGFKKLVERDIGGGNKLLFMQGNGTRTIYNEASGHKDEQDHPGVWFSNSYSLGSSYRSKKNGPPYGGRQNMYPGMDDYMSAYEVLPKEEQKVIELKPQSYVKEDIQDNNRLQTLLTEIGPDAYLLKPKQKWSYFGFGWVFNKNSLFQGNRELQEAHKEFSESATKIIPIDTKIQESKLNTVDFRIMSENEIMQWVLDFPKEAAKWLLDNLRFSGGLESIEKWVQMNLEGATEFIYQKTHFNKIAQGLIEAPLMQPEEQIEEFMIAI